MKIELNKKEVGQVVESLLALKSIIYEYCDDVGTSYSYLFDNYYESETFDDTGEYNEKEVEIMVDEIDSFMYENQQIIDKLLKR